MEVNFPPSYPFLSRVRARYYYKTLFFAFIAFTERCKLLLMRELLVKGNPVNEVKDGAPLAFTRNLLSLCDLPLPVKE